MFDSTREQIVKILLETAYYEITFSKLAIDLEQVNVTVSHLLSFIKLNFGAVYTGCETLKHTSIFLVYFKQKFDPPS